MDSASRFVASINDLIVNPILALIFTAALFIFLWGGFVFIISSGNESKRAEGRSHMLWGVIGMVIMVSVFAILNIGLATLGIDKADEDTGLPNQHPLNQEIDFSD